MISHVGQFLVRTLIVLVLLAGGWAGLLGVPAAGGEVERIAESFVPAQVGSE